LSSAAQALLVLNLAYCVAALFVPGLPGWKMFTGVAPTLWTLVNAEGQPVDVRAYLPRFAYGLEADQALRVARFVCSSHTQPTPLRFFSNTAAGWVRLSPPDCRPRAESVPAKGSSAQP
jgi:hypothetical protein